MMMTPLGLLVWNVTLAHDDHTKETMGFWDVNLAFDDNTKGNIGSRDVTLAYDDDAIMILWL